MTIDADHLALVHLLQDALPRPTADPVGDVEFLISEMIELEYNRILFPTIDTRVVPKELDPEGFLTHAQPTFCILTTSDVVNLQEVDTWFRNRLAP